MFLCFVLSIESRFVIYKNISTNILRWNCTFPRESNSAPHFRLLPQKRDQFVRRDFEFLPQEQRVTLSWEANRESRKVASPVKMTGKTWKHMHLSQNRKIFSKMIFKPRRHCRSRWDILFLAAHPDIIWSSVYLYIKRRPHVRIYQDGGRAAWWCWVTSVPGVLLIWIIVGQEPL